MSDVIASMNPTIWVFAALLIGLVCVQSFLFLRLALGFNKRNNLLSKEEISQATKTGIISVFGPSLSVIVVAFSLIQMVGPATTFLRCGVIGSPTWELMMANTSAEAVGVTFNSPEFTTSVFTLCIFGMTWASAPYFINTILTLKPLDLAIKKVATASKDKKKSFMPMLGNAAIMGIMGNSIVGYVSKVPSATALLVAAAVTYLIQLLCKNPSLKWIGAWNMAFAIIFGAAAGYMVSVI